MNDARRLRSRRWITVVLVTTITIAVAGYVTGTSRAPSHGGYREDPSPETHPARVPTQAGMAEARYADRNRELSAAFARLGPAPVGARSDATPAERAAMRDALRAFEGAPPMLPHAVDQRGMPACLACHQDGMTVNGRVAPAMTHTAYASCLQCHAPAGGVPTRSPSPHSVSTESTFVGVRGRDETAPARRSAP
jgi:cytochrome c-type protein NapB